VAISTSLLGVTVRVRVHEAKVIEGESPALVLAHNKTAGEQALSCIQELFDNAVEYFVS